MRTALMWVTTQRVMVIPYRRLGTTYGTDSFSPKRQEGITISRFVIIQTCAVLICCAAEA